MHCLTMIMQSPNDSICNFFLAWLASPENTSLISEIYEPCFPQSEDLVGKRDQAVCWDSLSCWKVGVPLIF